MSNIENDSILNNMSFINQINNNEKKNNKINGRSSYSSKSSSKRNKIFSAKNLVHINLNSKDNKIKLFSYENSLEKCLKTEENIKSKKNKFKFELMETEVYSQKEQKEINLMPMNKISNGENLNIVNDDNNSNNKVLGKMFSFEFGVTKN